MKQYFVFEDEDGRRTEFEVGRLKAVSDGEYVTLSCPDCGVIFAKYAEGMGFRFNEHIICCDKLRA